jgi:tungstate transport system substrate-binding protein
VNSAIRTSSASPKIRWGRSAQDAIAVTAFEPLGFSIVVVSTTSTKDTGLFEHLLPPFTQKTGIAVKVLAVGTGQALDIARRGDADVVFVHARSAEQTFVAEGHCVKRCPVTYNDWKKKNEDCAELGLLFRTTGAPVYIRTITNALVKRGSATDVRYWPKADIPSCTAHVCF